MSLVPIFYARAYGTPTAKGSGRCVAQGGYCRHIPYPSDKARLASQAWERELGKAINDRQDPLALNVAAHLTVTFFLQPPKKGVDGPRHHRGQGPDLDKLVRTVMDVLTACGVWDDDGRCAGLTATKLWATDSEPPGCVLQIASWRDGDSSDVV